MKILTRKNAEEADDQWLTEEDTKSFRELLINLLVIHVVIRTYRVCLDSSVCEVNRDTVFTSVISCVLQSLLRELACVN